MVGPAAISAEKLGAAMDRIVAKHAALMRAGVKAEMDELLTAWGLGQVMTVPATAANGVASGTGPAGERILSRGRLKWLAGCSTVWLDDEPCGLRKWKKARACLQLMVERQAFSEETALHLVDEIDPHVREQCGLPPAPHSIAKLQDYFKDGGRLRDLCKEIVKSVEGDGRYYLQVD